MKVVINKCFGGFGLSSKAEDLYAKKSGFELFRYVRDDETEKLRRATSDDYGSMLVRTYKKDQGDIADKHKNDDGIFWYSGSLERDDPILISVIEELGDAASGISSKLKVIEIPDGIKWEIDYYDGMESIAESHRTLE